MKNPVPYYCEAESGNGYDIAIVDKKRREYTLYRSYLSPDIDLFDEYHSSIYMCRDEFESMLKGMKKDADYDTYGYDPNRLERYYTTSQSCDLVDIIIIDEAGKAYNVEINTDILNTDSYDRFRIPINSSFVSRFIFDILCQGVQDIGFTSKEDI